MSVETSGIVVVVCGSVVLEVLVGSVVVVVSSSTGELVEELVDELDEVLDPSGSVVVSDGVVVDGVLPSSQWLITKLLALSIQ
jgi:hypothetical protein